MGFVCTKNAQFYSHYVINRSLTQLDFAVNTALPAPATVDASTAAENQYKARRRWIPLPDSTQRKVYLSQEPGDDSFDVETSEQLGVCTDVRRVRLWHPSRAHSAL
jgi:hypothetical protein